jgi:putative ABC transport system substrate-binding protein
MDYFPTRRQFVQGASMAGLGLLVACGHLPWQAPPPLKRHRLGWLGTAGSAPAEGLWPALREFGYVEGDNLVIEYRYAEGHDERLPALAAELARLPVDLLLVAGTPATQAAQQATQDIPIVMAPAGDPVVTGLATSLSRPGSNVTGVMHAGHQLTGKRLELLQAVQPALGRVGVLWRVGSPGPELGWREAQEPARTLGLELISLELRDPEDFEPAFATAMHEHVEALFTIVDQLIQANRQRIVDFAARSGLLGMYHSRRFVQDGGLMAYGADSSAFARSAAAQVDRILRGAKPADLPIEQPTAFEFVINLRTAHALGLTIPLSVLAQATEVIQ